MPPTQTSMTRLWSVTWDVHFLKNFPANWSASTSRTFSLLRNTRHRTTSYVLPLSTLAKSCHSHSFLSNLTNNILLPAYKLLFLSSPSSQSLLTLMPWTWHASSSLPKRKKRHYIEGLSFYCGQAGHWTFTCPTSQPIDMSKLFKTSMTLQLLSLPHTVSRTWGKNSPWVKMHSGTKAKCF